MAAGKQININVAIYNYVYKYIYDGFVLGVKHAVFSGHPAEGNMSKCPKEPPHPPDFES